MANHKQIIAINAMLLNQQGHAQTKVKQLFVKMLKPMGFYLKKFQSMKMKAFHLMTLVHVFTIN